MYSGTKKHIPLPVLTAGYNRANKPLVPPTNSVQSGLLVYSQDDLAQSGQLNSFQVLTVGFICHISHLAAMLTKSIKCSQRSVKENDSRLPLKIYSGKTNCNRVVPKMSHLDQLATNKSLYFGL